MSDLEFIEAYHSLSKEDQVAVVKILLSGQQTPELLEAYYEKDQEVLGQQHY